MNIPLVCADLNVARMLKSVVETLKALRNPLGTRICLKFVVFKFQFYNEVGINWWHLLHVVDTDDVRAKGTKAKKQIPSENRMTHSQNFSQLSGICFVQKKAGVYSYLIQHFQFSD